MLFPLSVEYEWFLCVPGFQNYRADSAFRDACGKSCGFLAVPTVHRCPVRRFDFYAQRTFAGKYEVDMITFAEARTIFFAWYTVFDAADGYIKV